MELDGEFPVVVPYFMREIIEQISIAARASKFIDHASGISARFSIANYRTMVASARQRGVLLGERPAVPQPFGQVRIADEPASEGHAIGQAAVDQVVGTGNVKIPGDQQGAAVQRADLRQRVRYRRRQRQRSRHSGADHMQVG